MLRIVDPGDYTIFRSDERPWMSCTPDRLIYDEQHDLVAALELKCAWYESAKEWHERVPLGHQVQGQHTMYVLGVEKLFFAALLNGCSFKWHVMRRHEKFIERMLLRLDAFWADIQQGNYPNVDASEATARALAARYPTPGADEIDLEADFQELADEYDAILERGREDDKRKLSISNLVKERLGEFPVGILPDGTSFNWSTNGKGGRKFSRSTKVRVKQ